MGKQKEKPSDGHGCSRREFLRVAGAGLLVGAIGMPALSEAAFRRGKRVIVLGIDGMDPDFLRRLIGEGRMPNAKRLIDAGCFSTLRTSDPPQSPVAWANFISGTNPGGHGIFDFIARDPATQIPYLSSSRLEGEPKTIRIAGYNIPVSRRKLVNLRRGPTFWKILQENGIDSTVIRVPANFPPTDCGARSLSGLGTPDIHGSYGLFTFYTDKAGETSRDVSGGRIERVNVSKNVAECTLPGPVNSMDPAGGRIDIPFKVFVDAGNPAVLISIQGRELILKEGEWSDWVAVEFAMMPHLVKTSAICRFYLKKTRGDFALYVSPVNIDPVHPSLPLSTPGRYSAQLAGRIGRFYTQGIAEDTKSLSAGVLSDDEYRQQATYALDESLRMFDFEFGRFREGFFFHYFACLDLNSHMFWRTMDSGHPLYLQELARKHGDFLPWLYGRMDEVIGKAAGTIGDDDLLMVISDHGFASFRRQFNLNTWLMENGYASLFSGASRGAGYFQDTDWSRTRAYGLGINGLYINLKGREPYGVVERGAKDALADELAARLTAVRDPGTGEQVVSHVYKAADIYTGPYVDAAPDLIVGYNRNFRASWDTVLGKYPREVLLDNTDPWSGDHTLDAPLVPGIFLSNRRIKAATPALLDLAPTIMAEFGVPIPGAMTGKNVF